MTQPTESGFKKGDRVKATVEGVVTMEITDGLYIRDGRGDISYVADQSKATLLERPVEPLAVGSVVRGTAGQIWYLGRDEVAFVSSTGGAYTSSQTPESLARDVARGYKTLIHDGSKK